LTNSGGSIVIQFSRVASVQPQKVDFVGTRNQGKSVIRVTGRVCEKSRPKCSPTHFVSKPIHNYYHFNDLHDNWGYFFKLSKHDQSKQLPNRPKITQSGHPECATNFVT
jgi:hypothetical protein